MKSMFEIYGGKTAFDQWDLNQRVTCSCLKEGDTVVFHAHGKNYSTTAYEEEGGVWADVPNFLLKKRGELRVDLGYGLGAHLDCRTRFDVVKRDKPSGYKCESNVTLDGGACDWNQNNPSAPDYVKNRTHYTETEVILEKQTFDGFAAVGDAYYVIPSVVFNLADYDNVVLYWDGERYDCTVSHTGSMDQIEIEENGELVLVVNSFSFGMTEFQDYRSTASSHEIGIYRETIHKIDAKYLPDGVGGGGGVNVLLNIGDALYTEGSNAFYFVSPEIWTACHDREAVNVLAAYTDFVYFPTSYNVPTGTVDDEYGSSVNFAYDRGANGAHDFFYLYVFGNESAAFNYYDR